MTLRRALLALYSLIFIAACGGFIGLTWNENEKLDLEVGDFNLQAFISADDTAQVIFTTALGILIVFGLWTLLMSMLPAGGGGSTGMLRLKQSDGGSVEVTSQALERLVREELEALDEVRQAVPRVRVSGGAVDTDALVVIDSQSSIAHVTTVVNDAINRAFKEQVGVTNVKRPNIRISYDPVKGRPMSDGSRAPRMDPARPMSPPPASEPSEPVSWPEPPPEIRRAEPVTGETPPSDAEAAWQTDWDPATRVKPNQDQEQQ